MSRWAYDLPVSNSAMPAWIPPMKSAVGLPVDTVGWAAELKWDGLRIELLTDGATVELRSSTGRDVTSAFPELAGFGAEVGTSAVLDGEIVVFDGDRPSFSRVLQRLHVHNPSDALLTSTPVVYVIFDLLELDRTSLLELEYRTRRYLLQELLDDGPHHRVPTHVEDGADQLLQLARDRDLEGIVVKRLDSTYRPGTRSAQWRKVKIRLRQEFVVGGWIPGQGALSDGIGSLLIGVWDRGDLTMAGIVGSGLADRTRAELAAGFLPTDNTPFQQVPKLDRPPTWVDPTTVVEVEFAEWPADGYLRHPVFVGIRADQPPSEVIREIPPPGGG